MIKVIIIITVETYKLLSVIRKINSSSKEMASKLAMLLLCAFVLSAVQGKRIFIITLLAMSFFQEHQRTLEHPLQMSKKLKIILVLAILEVCVAPDLLVSIAVL